MNAVGAVGTVLSTGGWTHVVPLELPPAPVGTAPGVAFVADHRVQDGPLGAGWRLDGFSRLERRGQDGGVPHYDATDTYWLDGMRLWGDPVPASAGPGRYRLEKDDNRVFVYTSSANRWDVYRDGWRWRYGEWSALDQWRGRCATEHLDETRTAPCDTNLGVGVGKAGRTSAWLLSEVQDPAGNKIQINYTSGFSTDPDPGLFGGDHAYVNLPSQLVYAGGYARLSFEYRVRPDVRMDARSGRLRTLHQRLSAVQVQVGAGGVSTPDARYELEYLDEAVEACPGEELPDPTVYDLESASVLHRIVRSAVPALPRTVRCIVTETSATEFSWEAREILAPEERGDADALSVSLANVDGDPWTDLIGLGYSNCDASMTESGDLDFCRVRVRVWRMDVQMFVEGGGGSWEAGDALDPDRLALVDAPDVADELENWYTDDFLNCDGRAFVLDVNRDGATDVVFAAGTEDPAVTTCEDPTPAENTWGILYGDPDDDGTAFATSLDAFPLDATRMEFAQFVDIDADGLVDLLLPDEVSPERTNWIRNSGWTNPFGGAEEALDLPLEDPTSSARTELDLIRASCPAGSDDAPRNAADYAFYSFEDPDQYARAMARWGDYNGDGVADVAYSFWACWEEDSVYIYVPVASSAYSRVFYGDGRGGFHEAPTGAGPAGWHIFDLSVGDPPATYLETYGTSGVVDLDRSGRPDLAHAASADAYMEPQIVSSGIGLGSLFGFDPGAGFEESCPNAVCERTEVPVSQLGYSGSTGTEFNAFVDVDADLFPDLLHVDVSNSGRVSAGWYANERSVARNRIVRIHEAWGGVTELAFASSVEQGDNAALPYPVEVIASVDGERGRTEFGFEGAYAHDGNFAGFAEAWVQYASGRTASVRFGQSPPVAGDPVSRTEYRADGTIETYAFTSYVRMSGSQLILDVVPPYFNPPQRECVFLVGPGASMGDRAAQSVDEGDLVEDCVTWSASGAFSADQWEAAMGWTRDYVGNVDEVVWSRDNLIGGVFDRASADGSTWPGPTWSAPSPDSYPDLATQKPAVVLAPDPPLWAAYFGAALTTVDTYVTEWAYSSAQRVATEYAWRDIATTGDDLRVEYARSAYSTSAHGEQLLTTTWKNPTGTQLRKMVQSDFAVFQLPRRVDEYGRSSSSARTTRLTYLNGEIQSQQDADGYTTTWTRNSCGLPLTRTDAVGRVEQWGYDSACRATSWAWQGATRAWERDGLGRVWRETTQSGAPTSTPVVVETYRDDTLDVTDFVSSFVDADGDRAAYDEPRMATVEDDTLTLTYLDGWGRQALEIRCEAGPSTLGSSVSSVLAGRDCVAGTRVYRYTGYAEDGSLRVETQPWAEGEIPAPTFGYRDVFGRVERLLAPAPTEVVDIFDADWVTTSFSYAPGYVETTDPEGTTCGELADTLGSERWCEGVFRGSTELDLLGRIVAKTDGDGVTMRYAYDEAGRVNERWLDGTIPTVSGAASPVWRMSWSNAGRLQSVTDPAGNLRTWSYDGVGRPRQATFDGATSAPRTVGTWTWYNHTTSGTRRVVRTDVNGYTTTEWLDGLDRTWKRWHPDGNQEVWSFDASGQVSTYTDVDGVALAYDYFPTGELAVETHVPTGAWRSWGYNGAGQVTESVDRDGVETQYRWTWDGRPAGVDLAREWSLSSWEYRSDGLPRSVTEGGVETTYTYDTLGRQSTACVGLFDGGCGYELWWTWSANDRMESASRRTPGGPWRTTSYNRNALGWVGTVTHPDSATETFEHDILGNVRSSEDESGRTTAWTWDDWGRPTSEDRPDQLPRTYSYAFGTGGTPEVHTVREPDGGEWITSYDFAGRATREEYPEGGLERVYDGSRLMEVWHFDNGWNATAIEALAYDAFGNVAQRFGPVEAADYPTPYDPGSWTPGSDYLFEYAWTDAGRLETVTGPNDVTEFGYTSAGLLASEDVVGVTTHTYGYDDTWASPRVATVTTSDGYATRTKTRSWEARGLWVSEERWEQGGATQSRTYSDWDAYGAPETSESWYGSGGTASLEVAYTDIYDVRGQLSSRDIETGSGWTGTVGYFWQPDGKLGGVSTSWAGSTLYAYDATTGWLTGITSSAGVVATYPMSERDQLGRAQRIELGGGGEIAAAWDQMGRVVSWEVETSLGERENRAYTYDARGRLETRTTTWPTSGLDRLEEAYTYQEPGWLVGEDTTETTGGASTTRTQVYDYDAAGNRERRWEDGVAGPEHVYASGNVLTSVGTEAVTWDGLGGMVEDHRGYSWERNPDGSERALWDGGVEVHAVRRDASGRPVEVDDGLSPSAYRTVWGNPGGEWPLAGTDEQGEGVLWVAAEGVLVGQVRGGAVWEAASGPDGSLVLHGETLLGSPGAWGDGAGAHPVGAGATERYVYAGLQSLPGTPFSLARQRAYDPEVGRFTRADPIGLAGGDNRFGYANGDPLGFVDPEGYAAVGHGGRGSMYTPTLSKDERAQQIAAGRAAFDPYPGGVLLVDDINWNSIYKDWGTEPAVSLNAAGLHADGDDDDSTGTAEAEAETDAGKKSDRWQVIRIWERAGQRFGIRQRMRLPRQCGNRVDGGVLTRRYSASM